MKSPDFRKFGLDPDKQSDLIAYFRTYHTCTFCEMRDYVYPLPKLDAMGRPKSHLESQRLCMDCMAARYEIVKFKNAGIKFKIKVEEIKPNEPNTAGRKDADVPGTTEAVERSESNPATNAG